MKTLHLDGSVANASQVTHASRAEAGAGISFSSPDPVLLPRGMELRRIGHRSVRGESVLEIENFMSPWWVSRTDFAKIFAMGQQDAGWAGRVCMAIAEQWGGDCSQEVCVTLREPLYAWMGQGRAISGGRSAVAVPVNDPRAYWFPEASIKQLFIPGLRYMPLGRAGALCFSAFERRATLPLLIAGNGQQNLGTQLPFASRQALPAGRRPTSIR